MSHGFPPWLERQQGYLSSDEQARLSRARAAVLGCGGVGGVAAELLVRAGVGRLALCDGDVFTPSNLNRQLGATSATLGQDKAQATAIRLQEINPELSISLHPPAKAPGPTLELLSGCVCGVLAIDDPQAALTALRAASDANTPLVEAVALPVVQLRVFMPGGPQPPWPNPDPGLRDGDGAPLALDAGFALASAQNQATPSLGPLVWMAGAMAALEAIKLIIGQPSQAVYPQGVALDPCAWKLHG